MAQPVFHVFVGSTHWDLKAEHHALEALLQGMLEFKYRGMEYFGSQDPPPLETSLAEVDGCDVYVGIFAGRYGSGITEAEYRRAVQKGLSCLIYFKADKAIPLEQRESDPEKIHQLAALKEELRSGIGHTSSDPDFTSPDELATHVARDLHNWLSTQRQQQTALRIHPFVCVLGAAHLFGDDRDPNAFSPSQREYRDHRVHRPSKAAAVETALRKDRFACVLGAGASGKTTLALSLAFDDNFGPDRSFYCDLAEADDGNPQHAESCRAALAAIAQQHGPDALVIVDNIHLAERLASSLHAAWRDNGKPVRLLLQGRLTSKSPDPRGRQSPLAHLQETGLTLTVGAPDLAGVVKRLAARRENNRPASLALPDDVLGQWLTVFGGDLVAFSFAARRKLSNILNGNYQLTEADATDYVRDEYLKNRVHPISPQERENLLALASCADIELPVPVESLPCPGELVISTKHGLVWHSAHGREAQFHRCCFHHPGMGKLIWAATSPDKSQLDYQCILADRSPHFGFLLGYRLDRVQGNRAAAKEVLIAAIRRADAFERLIEHGMGYLYVQCQQLTQSAVLAQDGLDQRLTACSNLTKAALATPLHFLQNFLKYAQDRLPNVFTAISKALAEDANLKQLAQTALAMPLGDLPCFLEYAQGNLPDVFTVISKALAEDANREQLVQAALATQLGDLRCFLEYAQDNLPDVFTVISGALTEGANRDQLVQTAMATPLHFLGSFLEYAQNTLPNVFTVISEALAKDVCRDKVVKNALDANFNNLSGFLRYTSRKFPDLFKVINAAIAADIRAAGIQHGRLVAVRRDPQLLVPAEAVLTGCGCGDFIEGVARRLIQEAASDVWQRNEPSINLVSTVLRLGRGVSEPESRQFLTRIVTPEWLKKNYEKLPPQDIAVALQTLWAWTPRFVRESFRSEALIHRASGLVRNLYRCERPARAIAPLELLGSCACFGVDVTQTTRQWPLQTNLDTILEAFATGLGGEHITVHQAIFLVGLRIMARCHPARISIPIGVGERILSLWRATEAPNPNHRSLNAYMIAWLDSCACDNWQLLKDDAPIPEPVAP